MKLVHEIKCTVFTDMSVFLFIFGMSLVISVVDELVVLYFPIHLALHYLWVYYIFLKIKLV